MERVPLSECEVAPKYLHWYKCHDQNTILSNRVHFTSILFQGDKNNGFDVLYHNMKYGLVASKELSEFFREKSNIEETNSKLMIKLANKANSGCVHGTFAPIWVVLKSSAEKLSSLHLQMVQKISELVKDVSKYADELHKKHKSVKEEEAGTLEAVQAMQASTVAVQKAKDLFSNKMQEFEKLRKDNSSTKDIEKAETKLKKQQDDYKQLLDKHNPVKAEFERRMTITCKVWPSNSFSLREALFLNAFPCVCVCSLAAIPRPWRKPLETDEGIPIDVHWTIAKQSRYGWESAFRV